MSLPLNILLLVSLLKYLQVERSPKTCAIIWAIGSTVFSAFLGFGGNMWIALALAPVRFGLGLFYFWLLEKYDESFWYWVILIAGLAIIIV